MSDERGPRRPYEVTWTNGHVETIWAHQVLTPTPDFILSGRTGRKRYVFHAEIEGNWTLLLDAAENDIRTIREKSTEDVAPISPVVPGE